MGDHGRRAAASRESGRRRWGELVVVELVVVVVVVGEGVVDLREMKRWEGKRETEVVLLAITLTALEQANDPCTPNTIPYATLFPRSQIRSILLPATCLSFSFALLHFVRFAHVAADDAQHVRRHSLLILRAFLQQKQSSDALCRCCLSHAGACGWCWWLHMVGRANPLWTCIRSLFFVPCSHSLPKA